MVWSSGPSVAMQQDFSIEYPISFTQNYPVVCPIHIGGVDLDYSYIRLGGYAANRYGDGKLGITGRIYWTKNVNTIRAKVCAIGL